MSEQFRPDAALLPLLPDQERRRFIEDEPGSLLAAAKRALLILGRDLQGILECHCLLNPDLTPRRETIEDSAIAAVAELEEVIEQLRTAISNEEARHA